MYGFESLATMQSDTADLLPLARDLMVLPISLSLLSGLGTLSPPALGNELCHRYLPAKGEIWCEETRRHTH